MNATDLKQIDELLQKRLQGFVTKSDLKGLTTKDDLKGFATKDDLQKELTRFATKDDLAAVKKELMDYIAEGEVAIISGVEKHVIGRIEAIEHQLQ